VPPAPLLARICNPCLHPLRWREFAIRASTPYAGADLQSVPPAPLLVRICNPCLKWIAIFAEFIPQSGTTMAIPGEVLQTEKAETRHVVFSSLIF